MKKQEVSKESLKEQLKKIRDAELAEAQTKIEEICKTYGVILDCNFAYIDGKIQINIHLKDGNN